VKNFNVKNSIGQAVGFKIAPQGSVKPFAPLAEAAYLKRAQFLDHQVWVTKFNTEERYPAGDFPNQSPVLDGLPVWIKRNHSIDGEDVVFWHVFGVTHCPRPEEWPIMPVEHCGFKVMPFGFFDHSPAMDIPPSITCHEQDNVKKEQCSKAHEAIGSS
jgi:primary-amine oxidase